MADDFLAMQQQAIAHLKEMQSRALPQEPAPPPKPAPAAPPQKPPRRRGGPFAALLSMDSDVALILPLLLLLGREGADDALLLALLYIMM